MNHLLILGTLFVVLYTTASAVLLPFFPHAKIGKSYPQFYCGFIIFLVGVISFGLVRLGLIQTPSQWLTPAVMALIPAWIIALTIMDKDFSNLSSSSQKAFKFLTFFYAVYSLIQMGLWANKLVFYTVNFKNFIILFGLLLSGAIFLAYHIMCMIFGHWYLVNKELPIVYLKKATRLLIGVSYLRVITCALSCYFAYETLTIAQFSRLTDVWGHGIFFWGRFLTGLGVPLLVAHLAYESAKIGSNQSATGILYAGNIFVLMGEIMALYLFTLTGVVF